MLKKNIKTALLIILVAALTIIPNVKPKAEGLVYDGVGYKYQKSDGSYATNCRRSINYFAMHFGKDGYADKLGFDACAGHWKNTKKGARYYFDDGRVPTGGWLLADGKHYQFENGYVVSSDSSSGSSGGSSGGSGESGGSNQSSKASNNTTNNSSKNNSSNNTGSNAETTVDSIPVTDGGGSKTAGMDEGAYVYTANNIFHSGASCSSSGMTQSTPMPLRDARARGYTECRYCW